MFPFSFSANFTHGVFIHTPVHYILWATFYQLYHQNRLLIQDPVENHCFKEPFLGYSFLFYLLIPKANKV